MGTTAAQKKLFFNLRRLKGQMQAIDDGDLQPEQVAKIARVLDVPEQDVVSMNRRLAAPDHSLNAPVRQDSEGEWQDWLVDETESQETALADREELTGRKALLTGALKTLNERERHILIERRLKDNPTTLEDLSQQYNISRERVRQIEVRAFEKLQKAMKAQIAERRLQSQSAVGGLADQSASLSSRQACHLPITDRSGPIQAPFFRQRRSLGAQPGGPRGAERLQDVHARQSARASASSQPAAAALQARPIVRISPSERGGGGDACGRPSTALAADRPKQPG